MFLGASSTVPLESERHGGHVGKVRVWRDGGGSGREGRGGIVLPEAW